jgi:prepilin-type N-terminal cleavage/methylation domain-containing protein
MQEVGELKSAVLGRGVASRLRNNQKGFTLIELLVVVSILGILAAVVTMSMVGITAIAQKRAGDTEKLTVQAAMDTMLADQGVDANAVCAGIKFQGPRGAGAAGANTTNDMEQFPTDRKYSGPGSGNLVSLYPHYLRQSKTHGDYHCVVEKNPDGSPRQDAGVIEQDRYSSP